MNQDLAAPSPNRSAALDVSLLVMRLIVGLIFAVHGSQKVFGLFGGPGLAEFVRQMNMGPVGYLVAIGECFGGLGIMVGLFARFSAAANIVIMLGAIVLVHGQNGFLMSDNGFEYNLALIGLLIPILILGPGRISLGRFLPLPKSRRTGEPVAVLQ
jgi:putative oxidoreductase